MNKYILFCLGVLSGFLSYHGVNFLNNNNLLVNLGDAIQYFPGIIFGILIGIYFFFSGRQRNLLKLLIWIVISSGSYYAAVYSTITNFPQLGLDILKNADYRFSFLIGGTVGSLLMLIGYSHFLHTLTFNKYFMLVLLGGFLGGLSILIKDWNSVINLYTMWQGGMAFALGRLIDQKEKKQRTT